MKVVEFLFPEITGIYGDAANIKYLSMCNKDIKVINDDIDEIPYFVEHDVDLIYMGAMTKTNQETVIERLIPYKERLNELIDKGVIFIVTNNALEVFGNYIQIEDRRIECLGLLDFCSKHDYSYRLNTHFLGLYNDIEVIGFKTQFHTICDRKCDGLFKVKAGLGNNNKDNYEGVRRNNFMGTSLLGPLLIQNPLFDKEILKMLGLDDSLAFTDEIMDSYTDRANGYNHFLLKK